MTKLKIRASVPDILFLNTAVSVFCLTSFEYGFDWLLLPVVIPVLLYGYLCILVRKPETRTKKSLLLRKIQTIIPTILVFAVAVWGIVSCIRGKVFSDILSDIVQDGYIAKYYHEELLYLFFLIMFIVIAVRNYLRLRKAGTQTLTETVSVGKREVIFNTVFLSLCLQGIFYNLTHIEDYIFDSKLIFNFSNTNDKIMGYVAAIFFPAAGMLMHIFLCRIWLGTLPVMQKKKKIRILMILNIVFLLISVVGLFLTTADIWVACLIAGILFAILLYQNIRSRKTLKEPEETTEPDKNPENPVPVVRMLPVPEQQAAVNIPVQPSEPETEALLEKLRSYEQEISRQKEIISQQQKQIAEYQEKSSVPVRRILTFAPLSETEIKKLSE